MPVRLDHARPRGNSIRLSVAPRTDARNPSRSCAQNERQRLRCGGELHLNLAVHDIELRGKHGLAQFQTNALRAAEQAFRRIALIDEREPETGGRELLAGLERIPHGDFAGEQHDAKLMSEVAAGANAERPALGDVDARREH